MRNALSYAMTIFSPHFSTGEKMRDKDRKQLPEDAVKTLELVKKLNRNKLFILIHSGQTYLADGTFSFVFEE